MQRGRSLDPGVDCRPRHGPQERRDLKKTPGQPGGGGHGFGSTSVVTDLDFGVVSVRESTHFMAPKAAMVASSIEARQSRSMKRFIWSAKPNA